MAEPQADSPQSSGPQVGMLLIFEGREWAISGRSSHKNPDGWQITEWECQAGGTTGYLLKEIDPSGRITWFFTREIGTSGVRLSDDTRLEEWLAKQTDRQPPPTLTYDGTTYRYAETTEGTHEDDSGESAQTTTWDYWDDRRQFNLALEFWPDASVECYRGEYIAPGQFVLRAGTGFRAARLAASLQRPVRVGGRPLRVALLVLLFGYLIGLFTNRPVDGCLSLALALALAAAWLSALRHATVAALAALVVGAAAAVGFRSYPPLTTWLGAAALISTPVVVAGVARARLTRARCAASRAAATLAVAAPLTAIGLLAYFRYAPGPHTPEQYLLALGPAAIGGAFAFAMAALLLRVEEGK
jgi:hypothetical protein